MQKTSKKRTSVVKKILLAVAAVPIVFILYLVISSLLSPVFDNIDKARFEKLKVQSQSMYEAVKAKSGGAETWTYEAKCDDVLAGPWPTGEFLCSTSFLTEVPVANVAQVNALHEKYYSIINTSGGIKQKSQLDKQYPGQFGVNFVVSSAEQKYTSTSSDDVTCTYLAALDQPEEPIGVNYNQNYGVDIATGTGSLSISFRCTDIARDNWYGPPNNY